MTEEITCGNCGVVLSEKAIDFGPENAAQTMDEYQNSARTGQKISLKMADMGLSTIIQAQDRDSSGKSLSRNNKQSFYRLRMWDRNSRSANTKQSFVKAFTFLDGMRSKLGLPEHVVEKSAYLFRKVEQKRLLHGRSNQSVLCAVVYMACRITDTPRTLNDIADAAGIKKKVIQRVYRLLSANLEGVNSVSYSPAEFIERISSEVTVSEKTRRDARKILQFGQKRGITSGKHPMSMAAAAVYLAIRDNREKVSQTRIAQASGISAVTIRNRVKELQVAQRK
ncbi:transcription factor TFIIB [Nitrosopumilus sp.]|uniref:transcription initiation factor IIB n=1 Tax=Nitrosopumilus sp. TaxID=2024843 RepID=UPI00292CF446|nr:transcription factor TFIIB [Nitrosopumilus sp.]